MCEKYKMRNKVRSEDKEKKISQREDLKAKVGDKRKHNKEQMKKTKQEKKHNK